MSKKSAPGAPPADLEEITDRFESEWRPAVDVADYLPVAGTPNRTEIAVELVRLDLEYRWKSGEQPVVEDYLDSLPDCHFSLDERGAIAFEEYRLRHLYGAPVSREAMASRTGVEVGSWPRWTDGQDEADAGSSVPAAVSNLPRAGQQFHGYELVGLLGEGAFGKVFLARQSDLANRFVALKITAVSDHEPQTLARLQHTNIVPIYSLQRDSGLQSICMPFLGLVTIRDLFVQAGDRTSLGRSGRDVISTVAGQRASTVWASTLPAGETEPDVAALLAPETHSRMAAIAGLDYQQTLLWMFEKIADGLAFAHSRGVVHGDMKPGNVLVGDDGQPLILDFHLATGTKTSGQSGYAGGTLPYMSVRHLKTLIGDATLDPSCDIFSVGVMMFEALTGEFPWPGRGTSDDAILQMIQDRSGRPPRIRALNPRVEVDVASMVERCLEPSPEFQYQSAEQLGIDIARHLSNRPLQFAPNRSVTERARKWMRRHPRISSVTVMGFVGVLVALTVAALIGSRIAEASRIQATGNSRQFVQELNDVLVALTVPNLDEAEAIQSRSQVQSLLEERVGQRTATEYQQLLEGLPGETAGAERQAVAYAKYWMARSLYTSARSQPEASRPALTGQAVQQLDFASQLSGSASRAIVRLQRDIEEYRGDGAPARPDRRLAGDETGDAAPGREDQLLMIAELRRDGDDLSAIQSLSRLLATSPKDYQAWFMKGHCHLNLGQMARAEECYSMCIALDPESPWGWFQRGFTLLKQRQFGPAKADFDRCLEIDPDDTASYLNRALVHRGLGDSASAVADLSSAIQRGCGETRAWYLRYQLYQSMGQKELAQADFREFLERTPVDAASWISRGMAQLSVNEPERALADFRAALQMDPGSAVVLENIAAVQSEYLKELPAAIETMTRIVESDADNAQALVTRGVLHARNGQRTEAHADAMAALKARPNADILFRSAGVFSLTSKLEAGDAGKAVDMLRRAAYRDPQLVLSRAKEDSDLDPLRGQKEYLELIGELEKLAR